VFVFIKQAGGNQKFKEFIKSHGISLSLPIKEKYSNKTAQIYKEKIKAAAEGRPWKEPPPEDFIDVSITKRVFFLFL